MKPYYADDNVTLYLGDCLEITEWLTADVLVTDPPYGMAFRSNQRTEKFAAIHGDDSPVIRDEALAVWGGKPAAVFGTWRVPRPTECRQVLVWHKAGAGFMGDLTTPFGTNHEEVYLIGKWEKGSSTRRGSVITTESSPSALTTKIGHPTPKPVGLMEVIVSAAPNGRIADPFAGSGSTLIAARNLGRQAIGVELEERYCEIIATRLDQMCLDLGAEL